MDAVSPDSSSPESGLLGLATIARFHGVPLDLDRLRRELEESGTHGTPRGLVADEWRVGITAREVSGGWERLARAPLPVLGARRDGRYIIVLRVDQTRALVQIPGGSAAAVVPRGQFEEEWAERFILLAKPPSRGSLVRARAGSVLRGFSPTSRNTEGRSRRSSSPRWSCSSSPF